MSLFHRLKNSLRKRPKFLREVKEKIVKAFIYKGRTYYMFEDIFTTPTIRGLQALDYYDEFTMRCTKEFLRKHCEAVEAVMSNPKKISLTQLAVLNRNMKERLDMIPVPDHIFKLASVIFFDETENPYYFDRKKAAEKIERWKEDPEVLSFFLRTPLKDLIPYLDLQQTNLSTYLAVVERVNEIHLREVLSPLSEKGTKVAM